MKIPFLGEWTSIYQLFWCELQGYKVLTHCHVAKPCKPKNKTAHFLDTNFLCITTCFSLAKFRTFRILFSTNEGTLFWHFQGLQDIQNQLGFRANCTVKARLPSPQSTHHSESHLAVVRKICAWHFMTSPFSCISGTCCFRFWNYEHETLDMDVFCEVFLSHSNT